LWARYPCTQRSSNVNLPNAIDFKAVCGTNLDTQHPKIWGVAKPAKYTVWWLRCVKYHKYRGTSLIRKAPA